VHPHTSVRVFFLCTSPVVAALDLERLLEKNMLAFHIFVFSFLYENEHCSVDGWYDVRLGGMPELDETDGCYWTSSDENKIS
jgi:hypothetical protein